MFHSQSEAMIALLRETKETLNRDGWIQGNLHSPEGHCLVGGIHFTAKQMDIHYKDLECAQLNLRNTLTSMVGDHSGIGQWNDQKGVTRDKVFELIDKTIERIEYYADAS